MEKAGLNSLSVITDQKWKAEQKQSLPSRGYVSRTNVEEKLASALTRAGVIAYRVSRKAKRGGRTCDGEEARDGGFSCTNSQAQCTSQPMAEFDSARCTRAIRSNPVRVRKKSFLRTTYEVVAFSFRKDSFLYRAELVKILSGSLAEAFRLETTQPWWYKITLTSTPIYCLMRSKLW